MPQEKFEQMLTGGHPNSLGRTLDVVDAVLARQSRLAELYGCYFSTDEVVRLRTSSALKRITARHPQWVVPYIDKLLTEVAVIDQASAQWTLASLLQMLWPFMTTKQRSSGRKVLQENLRTHSDWIVLNTTMQTLAEWAKDDPKLKRWLLPHLERLSSDSRKSVSGRAKKLRCALS